MRRRRASCCASPLVDIGHQSCSDTAMAPAIPRSLLRWPSPAESDPAIRTRFVSIALVRTRHNGRARPSSYAAASRPVAVTLAPRAKRKSRPERSLTGPTLVATAYSALPDFLGDCPGPERRSSARQFGRDLGGVAPAPRRWRRGRRLEGNGVAARRRAGLVRLWQLSQPRARPSCWLDYADGRPFETRIRPVRVCAPRRLLAQASAPFRRGARPRTGCRGARGRPTSSSHSAAVRSGAS